MSLVSISLLFVAGCSAPGNSNSVLDQPASNSVLDQPASKYVQTGEALITIENVWGISLSNNSGEITLRELADQMHNYLQNSKGGEAITKQEMSIALEAGNSVHSILHRLFMDSSAIKAVQSRLLSDSL